MNNDFAFGYPIKTAKELGLEKYFKGKGIDVAGMAFGGGENGTDPKSPRVIVKNPYWKGDEKQQIGLIANEASRHMMGEMGYEPKFGLSDYQNEYRKDLGAYATNDLAWKQSIIGRIIGGEQGQIKPTSEQLKEADYIYSLLEKRQKPMGAKEAIQQELKKIEAKQP
jgi:hypothetical protein